jgi:hypothetical protein
MNNDSTVVDCAQPFAENTNNFRGEGGFGTYGRMDGPRPPRSTLGRVQLTRPRTSEEMRKLAEDVWRQRGLALIDPLLIADDFARQALINEANRLYGRNPEVR